MKIGETTLTAQEVIRGLGGPTKVAALFPGLTRQAVNGWRSGIPLARLIALQNHKEASRVLRRLEREKREKSEEASTAVTTGVLGSSPLETGATLQPTEPA